MKPKLSVLWLVVTIGIHFSSYAANRFWVATGPSNWNNTANWSNLSGGAGGFSVPVSADDVTFNAGANNCTIDVAVSIQSITVTSGYTGAIIQGANTIITTNPSSFSGGTFTGGSANITFGGNFTVSGTAFTATSGVLVCNKNFAFTSGSFIHNNGTLKFSATSATIISGTSPALFKLEFVGTGLNYTISSLPNITVANSLTISGSMSFNLNAGTIDVSGDINVTNTAAACAGTAQVNIVGTGTQNFNGAAAAGNGALPKLTINKTSGTLNLFNFPSCSNAFTYTAGTINPGTSTFCYTDGSASPYTIAGSLSLNNIEFLALANSTFTISAATTLTVTGNLIMAGTSRITINTGIINVSGNINLTNTGANGGGSATINIVGSGGQIMDGTSIAISQCLLPFIVINKPSGTLTLKGIISESSDWTYTSGTVNANTFSSTVVFGGNGLNVSSAGMSFYNVTVTGNTITLLNSLTIANNLNITGGRIAPGANTVNIAGNWNDLGTSGFTEATSTVNFNGSALQTITVPGGEDFNNATINNSGAGIQLANNVTVASTLTMTKGNIDLNGNNLTLGLSVANNGTLSYTAGTIIKTGSFVRWFKAITIAAGSALGLFPVGTAANYRPIFVSAPVTAPTTGGTIAIAYTDATTNSTVSFADGTFTVAVRKDLHWGMTTANGLAGGTYNLTINGTGFGAIGNVNDLRLTLVNSVVGTAGVNGGTTSNPQVNRTGLTLLNLTNTFYIGSVDAVSSALPVTLISFTATVADREVVLNWSTGSELNNDYFTVQKSKDAIHWENIEKVDGKGTSLATTYYKSYDKYPYDGLSFYRLIQTDLDGKQTYSSIVSVRVGNNNSRFRIYPNPGSDQILLSFAVKGKYEVSLLNTNGQKLKSVSIIDGDYLLMNVASLKAGIYFICINNQGIAETKKLVIEK